MEHALVERRTDGRRNGVPGNRISTDQGANRSTLLIEEGRRFETLENSPAGIAALRCSPVALLNSNSDCPARLDRYIGLGVTSESQ
jgi:hypothetical protein